MPEDKKKPFYDISGIIEKEPNIITRMVLTDFSMALLKDPEDAFLSTNLPERFFLNYVEARMQAIAKVISKDTGADMEQIINPATRTPEQQQMMLEISGQEMNKRFKTYMESNYLRAVVATSKYAEDHSSIPYKTIWENEPDIDGDAEEDSGKPINIPRLAALYFFALHTDIKPQETDAFDDAANQVELLQLFDRMDAMYSQDRTFFTRAQDFITAFVAAEKPADAEQIIKVVTSKMDSLTYPLDKPNSVIWNLLETPPADGQIGIHMEKRGSKDPVIAYYSIDFSEIEELIEASGGKIMRKLTQYDKRVCVAAASLYNSGQSVFSFTRLYEAMGNTGRPGKNDFNRMEAAIKKMNGAVITLNNQAEVDAGYKYPKFKYYGNIMPLEFVKAEIDGVTVDGAIHLFREPPLISFARERKQCTAVTLKMLQAPVNKTENTLAIEDYLIEYISRAKNERSAKQDVLTTLQRKRAETRTEEDTKRIDELKKELAKPIRILTATIFEKANIKSGATQKRAREETIPKLLKHYKSNNLIAGYTSDKNGYSITI